MTGYTVLPEFRITDKMARVKKDGLNDQSS